MIYGLKSFTRFGALFLFSPWSRVRAGVGWWGWEEDILLAPESEFQLQAAYSPSLPPQRPALVPSISRLRPRATLDSAGLGSHSTLTAQWRSVLGLLGGGTGHVPLLLPGVEG